MVVLYHFRFVRFGKKVVGIRCSKTPHKGAALDGCEAVEVGEVEWTVGRVRFRWRTKLLRIFRSVQTAFTPMAGEADDTHS